MEPINSGYIALVIVGIIFLGLQFWWISMTIRNGRNENLALKGSKIDKIKDQLESIFAKSE